MGIGDFGLKDNINKITDEGGYSDESSSNSGKMHWMRIMRRNMSGNIYYEQQ
jgi:hypothetical protein